MRYLILFILGFMTLLLSGCSDENQNAVFGAHPDNWYNDHPGNIERSYESYIAECGGCHGLDLMGSGGAPSCFSTSFNGSSCHPAGPVPHPLDGSFLEADNHGPQAKSDLTVCQACHAEPPTSGAGSNPQFNVGIFGNGCEDCHGFNYAHPSSWAGPPPNTRFHYSAGNIQQACTLCHGAALDGVGGVASSCAGCHAEVVNFTLVCTYCHGMPPDGVNGIDHGIVADISDHDVCLTCHGMKESVVGGTFSNVANYALFDTQTDTIGDHWDGNINMNSDTGYDELLYGCTTTGCHGLAGHTLSDSGLPVVLGAYGAGGGAPHLIGQDWLLPNPPNPDGHVAKAADFCVDCHTLTGGGQDPACQDCHVQGDPFVLLDCTSCHSTPPNTLSIDPLDRPDRQGAHDVTNNLTTSTQDCSACHQGGGTGELSHYDRLPDGTTPAYPADVVLATDFNSNVNGDATYNDVDRTCSGVSCHGGLITPDWLTESLDVDTQCENCHSSGTSDRLNSEYNSYYSGKHDKHVNGESIFCTVCHNTTKLAINHFTDLADPAQWLDTAGATIDGGATSILEGDYIEGPPPNSCTPNPSNTACHGTRDW